MYCSCIWLCPLRFPNGESTSKPGLLAHAIFRRRCTPGKAQQHRQQLLQGYNPNRSDPNSVQVRRSMRSIFAGGPQECEFQLYFFYLCPRAQLSWQNTWVTSERMIHSSRPKKSDFSQVFARKRQLVTAVDKYVKIVLRPRNNPLQTRGVITRSLRFRSKIGPLGRVTR
jgi:hypothetical protein